MGYVHGRQSAQCQYKLVAKVDAHGLGGKMITPDGKVAYEGVRALKLRDAATLLRCGMLHHTVSIPTTPTCAAVVRRHSLTGWVLGGLAACRCLNSGGADGAVIAWDVRALGDAKAPRLLMYGDGKQTTGPHRFVLQVEGGASKAAGVRALDCLPSSPDCFIAGTSQCDVWEVLFSLDRTCVSRHAWKCSPHDASGKRAVEES